MSPNNTQKRYWIAINGPSCAMSSIPLCNPLLTPTPEQMLGFPTVEEARRAQRICLEAPMEEVQKFLASLAPDVESGRIRVIQPEHPQPPIASQSIWTESAEMHQAIQRVHSKVEAGSVVIVNFGSISERDPNYGAAAICYVCDKPHAASGVVQISPDNKPSAAQSFPVCETCLAAADTDVVIRKFYNEPDLKISEGGEATTEQIDAMAKKRDESEH